VRALTSRGLAQLELGNIAAAKSDLQAVVAATPRSSAAAVNLAKAFAAERNLGEARNWYEKALSLDPESFDALNGIVATDVRTRSFDRAHSRVDQSIAASAGKPAFLAAAHYLKSTIFTAQQNAAAAEAELSKALAIDPNYLPAYSAYAGMLVAQNRVEEAIAKYKSIVEKSPSPPIYTMIGILEDSRGNTNAAERAYRSALEITPDNAIAANNLAWIIAESNGNLDEALQLARTAVMKNPKAADLYDTLGWIYLKKGLATPAVEQFKKALAAEQASGTPTNPGYRLRLGMALAKTGDKASARRELETSLRYTDALSPRDRADARNALASL
jgi:cellulose synthase operon protein C